MERKNVVETKIKPNLTVISSPVSCVAIPFLRYFYLVPQKPE